MNLVILGARGESFLSHVILGATTALHELGAIVVGKHGTHVAEELPLGRVTKHVLAEGSADVLVSTARV